jgi:hypothetical protein
LSEPHLQRELESPENHPGDILNGERPRRRILAVRDAQEQNEWCGLYEQMYASAAKELGYEADEVEKFVKAMIKRAATRALCHDRDNSVRSQPIPDARGDLQLPMAGDSTWFESAPTGLAITAEMQCNGQNFEGCTSVSNAGRQRRRERSSHRRRLVSLRCENFGCVTAYRRAERYPTFCRPIRK